MQCPYKAKIPFNTSEQISQGIARIRQKQLFDKVRNSDLVQIGLQLLRMPVTLPQPHNHAIRNQLRNQLWHSRIYGCPRTLSVTESTILATHERNTQHTTKRAIQNIHIDTSLWTYRHPQNLSLGCPLQTKSSTPLLKYYIKLKLSRNPSPR